MIKQLQRLNEIGESLSKIEHSLALLALGSVGVELERLDKYSDLDFFVICKNGSKSKYLENLDWLEEIHPICFYFQNTSDGFKVLYEDDIFCEFAVFEEQELKNIEFTRGRIVWKRDNFDDSLLEPKIKEKKEEKSIDFLVNEALTNLYVGIGRYYRGEKLSAYIFIQGYAFDRVLDLISKLEEPQNKYRDFYSISRRFEFRYPVNSKSIPNMLLGYDHTIKSAENILNFLNENFNISKDLKEKILNLIHSGNI